MCDRRKDIRDLFDSEVTVGEELEESVVLEQLGRQVRTEEGLAEVTRHRDHASRPSRAEQTISAAHERQTGWTRSGQVGSKRSPSTSSRISESGSQKRRVRVGGPRLRF